MREAVASRYAGYLSPSDWSDGDNGASVRPGLRLQCCFSSESCFQGNVSPTVSGEQAEGIQADLVSHLSYDLHHLVSNFGNRYSVFASETKYFKSLGGYFNLDTWSQVLNILSIIPAMTLSSSCGDCGQCPGQRGTQ